MKIYELLNTNPTVTPKSSDFANNNGNQSTNDKDVANITSNLKDRKIDKQTATNQLKAKGMSDNDINATMSNLKEDDANTDRWVLSIDAIDGMHSKIFNDEAAALNALAKHIGYDKDEYGPLKPKKTYYDDNGGRARVSPLPKGVKNLEHLEQLRDAFNRMETGNETPKSMKLLHDAGWITDDYYQQFLARIKS